MLRDAFSPRAPISVPALEGFVTTNRFSTYIAETTRGVIHGNSSFLQIFNNFAVPSQPAVELQVWDLLHEVDSTWIMSEVSLNQSPATTTSLSTVYWLIERQIDGREGALITSKGVNKIGRAHV